MKQIILHRANTGWSAQFVDDAEIISLFGSDTIPTAFTEQAPAATVLAAIKRLNPTCNVSIA